MQLCNLTPIQIAYYKDNHRFVVNPAGRRSRKTLIGKRKLLLRALNKPGRYFHGAPTHKQAKDIFWESVVKDTALIRKDKSETDLYVKLFNDSEIHIIGLDKPERIEGQPWHGCHITEFGNLKGPLAWTSNIRPVLSDTNGWALLDGVPEGRNFYYDMALRACNGAIPVTQAGIGSYVDSGEWAYYHWFSSDVLSAEEIADVRQELDDRTYRQEYEGSYETYEGAAYKEFGQHNLDSTVAEDPNVMVSIGMDFNVDPMTATLGHVISDTYRQFGEIWLNNANTFEMRDEILKRFGRSRVVIYPDSTGDSERSNAHKTDIQILKDAGFQVRARSINPEQRDRINTVNSFVKNRDKLTRYKVNPKTCPKTINDMNKRESLADGRLDKAQEKEQQIGHISDALGYLISYCFPIVKGKIEGIKI